MTRTACAASLALLCSLTASAAEPTEAKPAQANKEAAKESAKNAAPVAKVEVKGKADEVDPRRDDTASKTVMTQEEILKYGDTNVFDVLKRAPGVTVIGNSIRMRGLGNGYTQILVNGERPPPGFSLDAVPPDQIERIEIIRAATAEFSMQAIAGTVNIVLKKVVTKPQRDVRLNINRAEEKRSEFANVSLADKRGNLSWYLNANLQHRITDGTNTSTERFTAPDGQVTLLRESASDYRNTNQMAGLGPRLNWKLPNDDQLNLSAYIQAQRAGGGNVGRSDNLIGGLPAPDYVRGHSRNDYTGVFGNGEINWVAKLWGGKLDAKWSASNGRVDPTIVLVSATADERVQLRRWRQERMRFPRMGSSGKYTRGLFDGHSLAAGWEISRERTENLTHRIEGLVGEIPRDFYEVSDPRVRRVAAFIQDEWNVTKQWSMYLGARWEGIRTESSGTGILDTTSNTHVLSPVAQTLYKFPDKSGRQLRLAFTHTFKAPNTNQLSVRRWESDTNNRFSPDSSGNPALKPEQADGVDLTYEHFWAPGAVFSAGTSARRIRDYIRTILEQDANGRWLYHPVNDGKAQVRSLDVELKFPLKAVMKEGAPPLDLRFNLNRNWSKVDTVPGPDNRLDQQIPLSLVFGADYKREPVSWGINLAHRTGGMVRLSQEQSARLQARRDVDGYAQYSPRKGLDLRLSIGNALGVDNLTYLRYQDASGTSESWARSPQSVELRFNLGLKF